MEDPVQTDPIYNTRVKSLPPPPPLQPILTDKISFWSLGEYKQINRTDFQICTPGPRYWQNDRKFGGGSKMTFVGGFP